MDVRPKLAELLQQTLDEEHQFIGQLSPEELNRVGQVDAWSAKDLIAHLAGWKLRDGRSARGDRARRDDLSDGRGRC